jgi:hypothetical protein
MAAFDYRMALAKGLVTPIKEAQENILKSAGGDNVFKSESWWNEQYDKTIDKGFTETSRLGPAAFAGRGTFDYKVKQKGYDSATPIYEEYYRRRGRAGGFEKLPINTPNVDRRFYTVDKKLIGYDATKTRGLNEAELNSIVSEQKGQIAKTKREASQEDNKTKRNKRRGGGGLLSKAKPIEVKGLATAMPDLGVMSLYGSDSTLGVK